MSLGTGSVAATQWCPCALPMCAICGQGASWESGPSKEDQALGNSVLAQSTCQHLPSTSLGAACIVGKLGRTW